MELTGSLRDNDAAAPAEFPPEQPEADLVPDEDEYGAEEREEEEAEASAANSEKPAGEDLEMAGVENGEGEAVPAEEDEMSDDGSVDIEGESEDELEEEGEGEAADDDAMDVDTGDKPVAVAGKA